MTTLQDCFKLFLGRRVRISKLSGVLDDLSFDFGFSLRQSKKPRQLVILDARAVGAAVRRGNLQHIWAERMPLTTVADIGVLSHRSALRGRGLESQTPFPAAVVSALSASRPVQSVLERWPSAKERREKRKSTQRYTRHVQQCCVRRKMNNHLTYIRGHTLLETLLHPSHLTLRAVLQIRDSIRVNIFLIPSDNPLGVAGARSPRCTGYCSWCQMSEWPFRRHSGITS